MGSPQNGEVWRLTGSGVHDASLLVHCWRFLLLCALISGYLLHGIVPESLKTLCGEGSDVEFSIHCEKPAELDIFAIRWKRTSFTVKRLHKNLYIAYALHLRLKKGKTRERETLPPFNESSWSGVSATNRFVEKEAIYNIPSHITIATRGLQSEAPLDTFEFIVSESRERGFVSWEV